MVGCPPGFFSFPVRSVYRLPGHHAIGKCVSRWTRRVACPTEQSWTDRERAGRIMEEVNRLIRGVAMRRAALVLLCLATLPKAQAAEPDPALRAAVEKGLRRIEAGASS